jgi:hypothetical protein
VPPRRLPTGRSVDRNLLRRPVERDDPGGNLSAYKNGHMVSNKPRAIPSQLFASAGIGAAGGFFQAIFWRIAEGCAATGGGAGAIFGLFLFLVLLPCALGYAVGRIIIPVTAKSIWMAKASLATPALYAYLGSAVYLQVTEGHLSGGYARLGGVFVVLSFLFTLLGTLHGVQSDERMRRHLVPSLCAKCGYNLTGNVSGRCPECGARTSRRVRSKPRPSAQSRPRSGEDT